MIRKLIWLAIIAGAIYFALFIAPDKWRERKARQRLENAGQVQPDSEKEQSPSFSKARRANRDSFDRVTDQLGEGGANQ